MASKEDFKTDLVTLTAFLISEQQKHTDATGDFTILVTAIQFASKFISSKVRRAGMINLYGYTDDMNATGDVQKKLDVLANEIFVHALQASHKVCVMASEEEDKVIIGTENGKYIVSFDPLDGSSNIDANVSIGSIFGIWKRLSNEPASEKDCLQCGDKLVAAGYTLFGSSTQLILSFGDQVNGFTLDPSLGEFLHSHPNIRIPQQGAIYSVNEGNSMFWDEAISTYVKNKKCPENGGKPYSLRYVGSMVADVHRTLLYGGIFLYPADKKVFISLN